MQKNPKHEHSHKDETQRCFSPASECSLLSRASSTSLAFLHNLRNVFVCDEPSISQVVKTKKAVHREKVSSASLRNGKQRRCVVNSRYNLKQASHSLFKNLGSAKIEQIRNLKISSYSSKNGELKELLKKGQSKAKYIPPSLFPTKDSLVCRKVEEKFSVTPRTIALKKRRRGYPEVPAPCRSLKGVEVKSVLPGYRPQKVELSQTHKVVMKKESQRAKKSSRKEQLIPQLYSRTSLQMRDSFLPLEPCRRVESVKTEQTCASSKNVAPVQQVGILSSVKEFFKTTIFKR